MTDKVQQMDKKKIAEEKKVAMHNLRIWKKQLGILESLFAAEEKLVQYCSKHSQKMVGDKVEYETLPEYYKLRAELEVCRLEKNREDCNIQKDKIRMNIESAENFIKFAERNHEIEQPKKKEGESRE